MKLDYVFAMTNIWEAPVMSSLINTKKCIILILIYIKSDYKKHKVKKTSQIFNEKLSWCYIREIKLNKFPQFQLFFICQVIVDYKKDEIHNHRFLAYYNP